MWRIGLEDWDISRREGSLYETQDELDTGIGVGSVMYGMFREAGRNRKCGYHEYRNYKYRSGIVRGGRGIYGGTDGFRTNTGRTGSDTGGIF